MDGMFTTLATVREPIGAYRPGPSRPRARVILVAAAVHLTIIAAATVLILHRSMRAAPAEPAVQLVFAAPAQPPAPVQIAASQLAPQTRTISAHLRPAAPVVVAPATPVPHTAREARHPQRHTVPFPGSEPQPRQPSLIPTGLSAGRAAAPAPPVAPTSAPQALAGWESRVRQAVQDAAIYPPIARLQHRQGQAQVRFDYDHGAAARAAVVRTSQVALLDQAALAAVTRAAMPSAPEGLGPQPRTMLVWVKFGLTANE